MMMMMIILDANTSSHKHQSFYLLSIEPLRRPGEATTNSHRQLRTNYLSFRTP